MPKGLKTNPIRLTLLFTVIIAVIAIVLTIIFHSTTREVEILIAPTSAAITINGKHYENGVHRLPSGEVSVHIEKPDFISQDFTFDTTKNNKISTYLLQKDGTFSWYESHQEDDVIMSEIGSREAIKEASAYNEKHPVLSELPIIFAEYDEKYNYTEFRIDGGKFQNCSTDFCLKVTDTTGGNFDIAKELLQERGINPEDYEILYEYTPIIPLR